MRRTVLVTAHSSQRVFEERWLPTEEIIARRPRWEKQTADLGKVGRRMFVQVPFG
jgi:hypothetical protein